MGDLLTKTFKAQSTTVTDQGVFSAILAAWNVDRMNEQIDPHAFDTTIEAWQASGKKIPLHWDHEGAPDQIIGYLDPKSMMAREDGLYVEGAVAIEDSEVARDAWRVMKSGAAGLSFGYIVNRDMAALTEGEPRKLLELDVFEGTITPAPVNPETRVLETKGLDGDAKATWTAAYINDLPDSSFLYIAPGGSKDSDGKTAPRSLRYFPVKDASGNVDLPHVRNALARIPQAKVPDSVKSRATAAAQRMLAAARSLIVAAELPVKLPDDVLKARSDELAQESALGRNKDDGPELEELIAEAKAESVDDWSEERLVEAAKKLLGQYNLAVVSDKQLKQLTDRLALENAMGGKTKAGGDNSSEEGSDPEGAQSGNGDPNAPALDEEIKAKLRAAYAEAGAEPPEEIKALIEETSVEDDHPTDEGRVEGEPAEEPASSGQRRSRDPLKTTADMLALEHALGRPVKDGPELDPDPAPAPEPADELTLRRQTNALALELALGRGAEE